MSSMSDRNRSTHSDCPVYAEEQLRQAALGWLGDEEAKSLAAHLEQCPACQATLDAYLAETAAQSPVLEIFNAAPVPAVEKFARRLISIPANQDDLSEGDMLGPYVVLECLGKGGSSKVYDCMDTQMGRRVAIKVLTSSFFSDSQKARLEQEARLLAKLDDPGIVKAYEIKPFHEPPFIVMERIAGGTARELLARGPLPPRLAAESLAGVARSLHHAHQQGIVHRDIKPSNLLVAEPYDPRNRPDSGITLKLSDFGLAKSLDGTSELTPSDALIGTPAYMSPEQTMGQPGTVGAASDIYALGVVLYEFLIGNPPLVSDNVAVTLRMICEIEPVPPRAILRDIPRDLETICLKCLRKKPAERYASAEELADDLQRFLENRAIRARPIGAFGLLLRWCKRKPGLAASLGGILVLILSLAGMAVNFAIVQNELRRQAEASAARSRQAEIEAGLESDSSRNIMFNGVRNLAQVAGELARLPGVGDAQILASKAKAMNQRTIDSYLKYRIFQKEITGDRIDLYFRDALALRDLGFEEQAQVLLTWLIETAARSKPGEPDYSRFVSVGNRSARVVGKVKLDEHQDDEARRILLNGFKAFRLDSIQPEPTRMQLLERRALLDTLQRTLRDDTPEAVTAEIQTEIAAIDKRLAQTAQKPKN